MDKERRKAVFLEAKSMLGTLPSDWAEEINNIREDDSFDELSVLVGKMSLEWGMKETRAFLDSVAKPDEVDELMADDFDMFF